MSKSVLYLCRKKGCKAAEIARELNVPLLYIEDELDILSKGENGSYGLVREISKDKYIANIMLLEQEETEEMLREIQPEINLFIRNVHTYFQSHKEELETLPLLGKRQSLSYTAWTFFQGVIYDIARQGISQYLAEKFFPDAESVQREYSQMGIVCRRRQEAERPKWFYGMDRAFANQICGYKSVHFHNLYGERLEARFHTGENISQNEELQLTIRAVKGIPVNTLEEAERETAAKAIADGYFLQEDGVLYPKIVAVTKETWEMIQKTGRKICEDNRRVMEKMAEKIAKGIKRYVPKHLISEYQMAAVMVWSAMTGMMIEAGIQSGTLSTPTDGSEGTFLWIEE